MTVETKTSEVEQNNTESTSTDNLNDRYTKSPELSNDDNQQGGESDNGNENTKPENQEQETKTDENQEQKTDTTTEYKFVAPDGMELDQPLLDGFKNAAKELGLTQEQFDKLSKVYVDRASEIAKAGNEAETKELDSWEKEIKSDPDYDKNQVFAKKTLEHFFNKETQELFNTAKIGSHPGIWKGFVEIGKVISEPGFREGNTNEPVDKNKARYHRSPELAK